MYIEWIMYNWIILFSIFYLRSISLVFIAGFSLMLYVYVCDLLGIFCGIYGILNMVFIGIYGYSMDVELLVYWEGLCESYVKGNVNMT